MNSPELNNYIQYVTRKGVVKSKSVVFVDNGVSTVFKVTGINEDFFIFGVFQNNFKRSGIGFDNCDNVDMLGFVNSSVVDLTVIPFNSFFVSEQVINMSYNNSYVSTFNSPPVVFPAVQTVSINNIPSVQTVMVNNIPLVQTVNVNNFPVVQSVAVTTTEKVVPVYFNPQFSLDRWGMMMLAFPTRQQGYATDIICNVFDCSDGSYSFSNLIYFDSVSLVGSYVTTTVSSKNVNTVMFSRGGLYFKITETAPILASNYVKLRIYQNVITNEVWLKINSPSVSTVLREFSYLSMNLTANGFFVTDGTSGLKVEVSKIFF